METKTNSRYMVTGKYIVVTPVGQLLTGGIEYAKTREEARILKQLMKESGSTDAMISDLVNNKIVT